MVDCVSTMMLNDSLGSIQLIMHPPDYRCPGTYLPMALKGRSRHQNKGSVPSEGKKLEPVRALCRPCSAGIQPHSRPLVDVECIAIFDKTGSTLTGRSDVHHSSWWKRRTRTSSQLGRTRAIRSLTDILPGSNQGPIWPAFALYLLRVSIITTAIALSGAHLSASGLLETPRWRAA